VTYVIRLATPGDASAVTALLEASYPKLFAAGYDAKILATALPRMTKANPRLLASGGFFLAESEDRQIVGCGGWSKERPGTNETREGEAHIRHFATHPDWLRRGIGRAMIARCVAQAKTAAIKRFDCYSSLVAVDSYEAMGFTVVGPMTLELGLDVTLPGCLMSRALT